MVGVIFERVKPLCGAVMLFFLTAIPFFAEAQLNVSTTSVTISICGDSIVNSGEECDVVGETGAYSTTIAGRQCDATSCQYGPYCGDAILQTLYDEECDDGNNTDNDFCAADCTTEFADSGGGSTGGGGSSASGGSDEELGDTQVSIQGKAFPNATVNILIDAESVGTVRTNSKGEFTFNVDTDPGTASVSFWANDNSGTRSATVNTTFDITQGAVTNLNGILIPPTIKASSVTVNPGAQITLSGQTIPSATVEVSVDNGKKTLTATSDAGGNWTLQFDTRTVTIDTHTVKARFITGTGTLKTESTYGTALSLFVGVEGKATSNSDLNRDGKVNLIDFSILIFWWGTPGGNSNPPADINGNGKVGLEDFSILLFNWTG
jgi:cysteine-rich repeat protein